MKLKKVYVICPVRQCTEDERRIMDAHVCGLIELGGYDVHYPHTSVDQSNDDGGVRICREHLKAMHEADEVHVFWNGSVGSHFDLGMAYMLTMFRDVSFIGINTITRVVEKSFQNVLVNLIEGKR